MKWLIPLLLVPSFALAETARLKGWVYMIGAPDKNCVYVAPKITKKIMVYKVEPQTDCPKAIEIPKELVWKKT